MSSRAFAGAVAGDNHRFTRADGRNGQAAVLLPPRRRRAKLRRMDNLPKAPMPRPTPRIQHDHWKTRPSLLSDITDSGSPRWTEFMVLYEPLIKGQLRKMEMTRWMSRERIDDVANLAFAKVSNGIHQFDPSKGRFRYWLWAVVCNAACDELREDQRWQRAIDRLKERMIADGAVAGAAFPAGGDCPGGDVSGADDDDDRQFERRIKTLVLGSVARTVEPATWECFKLHRLEGLSGRQVAQRLGKTEGAVYKNCSEVVRKTREAADRLKGMLLADAPEGAADLPGAEYDTEFDGQFKRRTMVLVLKVVGQTAEPATWACFELRHLQGLSGPAVAQRLGMTADDVDKKCWEVLKKARELSQDLLR